MDALRIAIGDRRLVVVRDLLDPHEAALVLRCSARGVRRRFESGELPVVWVGHRQKVAVQSLLERVAGDPLALEGAVALAEGRLKLPGPNGSQPTLAAAVATAALTPAAHAIGGVSAPPAADRNDGQIMQAGCPRNSDMSDHSLREAA